MKNKQYYLAQRNNYFFGKLMTVRDFESEQNYFNSKRRLNNKMMGGSGIVSGLDVILVDNKTFSLEPGMALDYMGREIVVSEPYIRRLNVIKGFEENKGKGIVYLCLGYKEDLKETTFSVAGSGKSSGVSEEFNRISEGYELFLTSQKPTPEIKLDYLINKNIEIYNSQGVKLSAVISKYVNPKKCLKVTILFEKENVEAPVSFKFDMQGEFFKNITGEKEVNPRSKSQIEPRKQFFACYDTKTCLLYLTDMTRKATLTAYLSDTIQKQFLIKNVYASVDEFCARVRAIRGFRFTQIDNVFGRASDIFQQIGNIFGLDLPEKVQLKVGYGDIPVHEGRCIVDRFQKKRDEFQDVVIIGVDDEGVEQTFDFSSIIKHIEIHPVKDENEQYDPVEVRELLLAELRK